MGAPDKVSVFESLRIPNYRLFWIGGLISNIGTAMARVAQNWLVLTDLGPKSTIPAPLALGFVTAVQFLPFILALPWTGAAADRFPKRWVLQAAQVAMMLSGLTLAVLILTNQAQLWQVYVLAFATGIASAFEIPSRQAMAPEIVPTRLIPNAVGLNIISFQSARLIGPAVAGIMIAQWGVGPALLVNGLSFIPVIAALAVLDGAKMTPAPRAEAKHVIREGLSYIKGRSDIVFILLVTLSFGMFAMTQEITSALAADQIFQVGSEGYGFLVSILAIGSMAAGILAARRTRARVRTIIAAMAGFAICSTVLTVSPNFWVFAITLAPIGFCMLTIMSSCNTTVQMATDPRMLGRVLAIYQGALHGGQPLGGAFVGWVGSVFGPRATLAVGAIAMGLAAIAAALYLTRRNGWDWLRRDTKENDNPAAPDGDAR